MQGRSRTPVSSNNLDGGHPVTLPAKLHLGSRLGDVQVDAHVQVSRSLGAGAQEVRTAQVRRMRSQPGGDAPIGRPLPALDELDGLFQFAQPFVLKDSPDQVGAQPGFLHRPGHLIHVEIVIRHAGNAGFDHLGHAEQRTPVDVLRGQVGFKRENILIEPVFEGHIFSHAAEQHHRHVGVGVDHPRHGQQTARLDHLQIGWGRQAAGRSYLRNPVAHHLDILVEGEGGLPVNKAQHITVAKQQPAHGLTDLLGRQGIQPAR